MAVPVPVERFVGLVDDLKARASYPRVDLAAIRVVVIAAGVGSDVFTLPLRGKPVGCSTLLGICVLPNARLHERHEEWNEQLKHRHCDEKGIW